MLKPEVIFPMSAWSYNRIGQKHWVLHERLSYLIEVAVDLLERLLTAPRAGIWCPRQDFALITSTSLTPFLHLFLPYTSKHTQINFGVSYHTFPP